MNIFVWQTFEVLGAWFGAAIDLLLPRGCAGCDMPDEVLCPSCCRLFEQSCRKPLSGDVGCCYACGWYQGTVRHAILAWKDHGDEQCDVVFASLLASLLVNVLDPQTKHGECHRLHNLVLVPAPSSPESVRHRGRWQMLPLARRVARDLRAYGCAATVRPLLRLEGVRGKSVQTSGGSGRAQRIAGHVRATQHLDDDDAVFLVIDDIVTTGATMSHCMAALRDAGARHVMGFALACTPNKSD